MLKFVINLMIFSGSLLMVYNIIGFVRFARFVNKMKSWKSGNNILYIPIVLLVFFLLGYLAVGFFGKPDLIMAGILFGGSIFVFVMYKLLNEVIQRIVASERVEVRLAAAEESNRIKTSFLASFSHEMRTPLHAIIGLDAITLHDETLSPQLKERLEKIDGSAHHLLSLINDVLDMTHIDSDDMVLKQETFYLRKNLDIINVLAQTQCEEKGVNYHSETVGTPDDALIGDAMRLRQALLNVLGNAVKFTPAGGDVTFTTEQVASDDGRCTLRFTIRDTGEGIDPDYLPHIFDSFSQEDASTTNRYGGGGLGLAITKKLVDMMGGEIAVSSEKGKGSAFTVTIALNKAETAEDGAEGEAGPAAYDLVGRHVLIAEDIDLNADMLADLLELEGVTSERAENGQIAVDMFSQNPEGHFDAILMDLRMPVMDGLDATRAIRALDRPDAKTIPIIAVTANTFEEDVRQSLEAGMNAHLSKPADTEQLYATLEKFTSKHSKP